MSSPNIFTLGEQKVKIYTYPSHIKGGKIEKNKHEKNKS